MKADSPKSSDGEGDPSSALVGEPQESVHPQSSASASGRAPSPDGVRPQLPPRTEAQPERGWRNTFSSLKNRDYLYLWLGMMAMMGGMQMQMLARGYLVYDLTESASLLGIVSAGSAVPMLVLALFGGAIADRVERKRLIQIGQLIVGLLAFIVGLAIVMEVGALVPSVRGVADTGIDLVVHDAGAAGDHSSDRRTGKDQQRNGAERRWHERHDLVGPGDCGWPVRVRRSGQRLLRYHGA